MLKGGRMSQVNFRGSNQTQRVKSMTGANRPVNTVSCPREERLYRRLLSATTLLIQGLMRLPLVKLEQFLPNIFSRRL